MTTHRYGCACNAEIRCSHTNHGMCPYAYLKISNTRCINLISGSLPQPRGLCACRRRFFSSQNTPLDFWSMCFVDVVISKQFYGILVKCSKYCRSAQMTMPARRASKFCAKRRAALPPHLFSKSDFLGNSWKYGTLARMST